MVLWQAEHFELKDIGRLSKLPRNQGLSDLPFFLPCQAQGRALSKVHLSDWGNFFQKECNCLELLPRNLINNQGRLITGKEIKSHHHTQTGYHMFFWRPPQNNIYYMRDFICKIRQSLFTMCFHTFPPLTCYQKPQAPVPSGYKTFNHLASSLRLIFFCEAPLGMHATKMVFLLLICLLSFYFSRFNYPIRGKV